jgi:hypothetical protein
MRGVFGRSMVQQRVTRFEGNGPTTRKSSRTRQGLEDEQPYIFIHLGENSVDIRMWQYLGVTYQISSL